MYAVKVSKIMNLINDELHLRNISLEEKIKEQEAYIEQLKQEHEIYKKKVNAGFNHERAGSIIITPLNQKHNKIPNHYKLIFKDITIYQEDYPESIIINNIYNPQKMRNLVYFYIKNNGVAECKYINGGVYEIKDLDLFKRFINDLQTYNYTYKYNAKNELDKYLTTHKIDIKDSKTLGILFEFYCSMKYNIPLYKYNKVESLSLTKIDKGIDLIDIEHQVVGQCKYYTSSTLDYFRLKSYIEFCKEFYEWEHYLFVNSKIVLTDDINEYIDNGLIKVINIDENDFEEFIHSLSEINPIEIEDKPVIKPIEIEDKPVIKIKQAKSKNKPQSNFSIPDETIQNMREFIIEKLRDNKIVYLDTMIRDLNVNFELHKFINQHIFTHLFSDLYKKTRNETIPVDKDGKKILMRNIDKDEEIEFINATLGDDEMEKNTYIKIHNEHFNSNYNDLDFVRRFGYLFIHENNRRGLMKRMVNRKVLTFLKLIDS